MRGRVFKHQVRIEQRDDTVDANGQRVQNWYQLLSCRATVRQLQGTELIAAQSIRASVNSEVEIRYRADMVGAAGADLRVVQQGRILSVAAVMDREQDKQYLQLMCSEGNHES